MYLTVSFPHPMVINIQEFYLLRRINEVREKKRMHLAAHAENTIKQKTNLHMKLDALTQTQTAVVHAQG